ncbi:MAG TPA: tRNA (N6-threonylcarbamoyladenosine(37)-N6)-methyltransferase TrmO [Methanoculleus sp.]|nr:tRNA (N6-threonylcarbamoyladenosine(37)-N6)-methyltransferase TrmO [Methanoculleus sp.]
MKTAEVHPIGIVTSPYKDRGDAPRQGRLDPDVEMEIEIFPEYAGGIGDLACISHLFVLLWFDRTSRTTLTAHPPGVKDPRPLFATRSPHRPNPIGLDIGRVIAVEGRTIRVAGLDALDGTPVLDIKPYAPSIDAITDATEPFRDDR